MSRKPFTPQHNSYRARNPERRFERRVSRLTEMGRAGTEKNEGVSNLFEPLRKGSNRYGHSGRALAATTAGFFSSATASPNAAREAARPITMGCITPHRPGAATPDRLRLVAP